MCGNGAKTKAIPRQRRASVQEAKPRGSGSDRAARRQARAKAQDTRAASLEEAPKLAGRGTSNQAGRGAKAEQAHDAQRRRMQRGGNARMAWLPERQADNWPNAAAAARDGKDARKARLPGDPAG